MVAGGYFFELIQRLKNNLTSISSHGGEVLIKERIIMDKTVYIVHCVDAEGPLYETPEVPFEQLKKIAGVDIPATTENLIKLRNGTLDLHGLEKTAQDLVDIHKMSVGNDWNELKKQLNYITSNQFRTKLPDTNGNGWVYSWFCMDHVGFCGENPRRRDVGYHHIFDKYIAMTAEQQQGDIVQFHHHPVSHSGNYHECGTAFWGRGTLDDILTRRIIERCWFPTAFRPGFHTERPDSNWFLEQWIPFDYGNQSGKDIDANQVDVVNGRFGDWRRAPLEWKPYHPAYDDYQKKGKCNRWITRCLNMYARLREINEHDVMDAFELANQEGKSILAFTDHDFKDMEYDISRVQEFIKNASLKYKKVKFEYTDAITAMRKCCNIIPQDIGMNCQIIKNENNIRMIVQTNGEIFGPQPYLALKTKDDNYLWDNFDFDGCNQWSYTFDHDSIVYDKIEKIGVATNNKYGKCEILNYDVLSDKWQKTILN